MDQFKYGLNSNCSNEESDSMEQETQTTRDETNCSSKTIKCLEDLPNELFYDLFEYFYYFDVHEQFFYLNNRFKKLLVRSKLPIFIKLSPISKLHFEYYINHIVQPNLHRIKVLRITDALISNFIFPSLYNISAFYQINTLILDNIEPHRLGNLLEELSYLSSLSSLTISSIDIVYRRGDIYQKIFRLSKLKYCKLSFSSTGGNLGLPINTSGPSSIKHLIITDFVPSKEINNLLSYVPQLHRLSLNLCPPVSFFDRYKEYSISSQYLTHISFNLNEVKFNSLQKLIEHCPYIQILSLTSNSGHAGQSYMDGDQWKEFIESNLFQLRIFNIEFHIAIRNNDNISKFREQMRTFETPFWIQRKWFFAHQLYQSHSTREELDHAVFYSINPYRRKYYMLTGIIDGNFSLEHENANFDSVKRLDISYESNIMACSNYFPNVTELTFLGDVFADYPMLSNVLTRIIPLKKLSKLTITCDNFLLMKMLELLNQAPNIQTLIFQSELIFIDDLEQTRESDIFKSISETNSIKELIFMEPCELEQFQFFFYLCPQTKKLSINTSDKNLIPILIFLTEEQNQTWDYLCFPRQDYDFINSLTMFIEPRGLLDRYTMTFISSNFYLWK